MSKSAKDSPEIGKDPHHKYIVGYVQMQITYRHDFQNIIKLILGVSAKHEPLYTRQFYHAPAVAGSYYILD